MKADWVRLQVPDNLGDMMIRWSRSRRPDVGLCFLCGEGITAEEQFIPGTSTHDCEAGREFEAKGSKREV